MSTHNIYFQEYWQICGLDKDSAIWHNKTNLKYTPELISFGSKEIAQDMKVRKKCDTAHVLERTLKQTAYTRPKKKHRSSNLQFNLVKQYFVIYQFTNWNVLYGSHLSFLQIIEISLL